MNPFGLEYYYDAYDRIENDFLSALDVSLKPRGPEILYDLVKDVELPQNARAIDIGSGKGKHTIALAERFGLRVIGIEPNWHHIEQATNTLESAIEQSPALNGRIQFQVGIAEALPIENSSINLVWCRDMLVLIQDLDKAFAETARVLRDNGRVIIFYTFGTNRLEPREAEWLWKTLDVVPSSADSQNVEETIRRAGLMIDQNINLQSEWGEYAEEERGYGTRRLLHAARLIRNPEKYIAQFGKAAYDIMLGDCYWHIYRMIGKLSSRVYVLSKRKK